MSTPRLASAILALALLAPAVARAADPLTEPTDGTGLAAADFQITARDQNAKGEWVPISTTNIAHYFNRARCDCASEVNVWIEVTATGRTKLATRKFASGSVDVVVGPPDCASTETKVREAAKCKKLGHIGMADLGAKSRAEVITDARTLFATREQPGADVCSFKGSQTVYMLIDADGDSHLDTNLLGQGAPVLKLELDSLGPNTPSGLEVTGGNEALEVAWAESSEEDLDGYVVLCSRDGELNVFEPGTFSPGFASAATLCPDKQVGALTGATYATVLPPTGQEGDAPPAFQRLNPAYICSPLISAGQTSRRISILQNGIPYLVAVAAVDKHGNASPVTKSRMQTPVATRDFYREYRLDGGEAEGGFCAVGGGARRGWAARETLLLLAPAVALLWRRRRRRTRSTDDADLRGRLS